jgi:hypothetical protein
LLHEICPNSWDYLTKWSKPPENSESALVIGFTNDTDAVMFRLRFEGFLADFDINEIE